MKHLRMSLTFISSVLVLFGSTGQARSQKKIELPEPVSSELNLVLAEAVQLHKALHQQDQRVAQVQVKRLIGSLGQAETKLQGSRYALHVKKLLSSTKAYLLTARDQEGETKLKFLASAFHQLVQLVRTFKLKSYSIFFCGKDRAVWIQEGAEAANPIHPDTQCGIRVS